MHDGSRVAFLADWGNSGLDFTKKGNKYAFHRGRPHSTATKRQQSRGS